MLHTKSLEDSSRWPAIKLSSNVGGVVSVSRANYSAFSVLLLFAIKKTRRIVQTHSFTYHQPLVEANKRENSIYNPQLKLDLTRNDFRSLLNAFSRAVSKNRPWPRRLRAKKLLKRKILASLVNKTEHYVFLALMRNHWLKLKRFPRLPRWSDRKCTHKVEKLFDKNFFVVSLFFASYFNSVRWVWRCQ